MTIDSDGIGNNGRGNASGSKNTALHGASRGQATSHGGVDGSDVDCINTNCLDCKYLTRFDVCDYAYNTMREYGPFDYPS
jgi:hypothetical protein